MPIKREIVYPIFLECCQYTEDTFWDNIFEDLAYGKAPFGTYISKHFLCCNYKKKEFTYKIEKKDPEILYNNIYELLMKKVGILSPIDKVKKRKDFNNFEESIKESRKNWNDIRKKNMKELLIELFVTRMKNKYLLTIKQARYLISIIMIGLIFKIISVDSIDYRDGMIHNIEGIHFSHKKIFIEYDIYDIDINMAPNIILENKTMSEEWEKYLKNLRKF